MSEDVKTVTVTDRDGNEFEAQAGVDGENPISANNPPAKAVGGDPDIKFARHDSNSPSAEESKKLAKAAEKAVKAGKTGTKSLDPGNQSTRTGPGNGPTPGATQKDEKTETKGDQAKGHTKS